MINRTAFLMAQKTDDQKLPTSPKALSEGAAAERRRQAVARLKEFRKERTLGMSIKDAINEGRDRRFKRFLEPV
jgi:hypothetical protein